MDPMGMGIFPGECHYCIVGTSTIKNALVNVYITMESHHCLLVTIWLVVWNMNFIFHNIRDNPSHWLSFFSRWLLHHQPVMMIYIYIWWYMLWWYIIWWCTHIILTTFWEVAMVPILLFSFFHSHLSVSFTIRHPIAPQDKPVPNQHEPRAADQHATYHCFMATLWVILVILVMMVMMVMMVIMGHKKGHTGGIVGSKFITTGGIVCCLSCLLLQLYPSVGSLRSLRSRRSQVSCHLWKGAWRLRGRPGGLPQEDAQLERMGPGWGPDGDDTDGGCGEASLKTNIYRPGDTLWYLVVSQVIGAPATRSS